MFIFQGGYARASLFNPGGPRLVVTFDHWFKSRAGFAAAVPVALFAAAGCSQLHVQSSRNDWYISAELNPLLAAIRAVAADYDAVVNYGSSMGAFAAFLFSAASRAGRVIAISPQYSIDRSLCPFETRWEAEAKALEVRGLRPEQYGNPDVAAQIFMDPLVARDAAHARMLRQSFPRTVVTPLVGAGHAAMDTVLDPSRASALGRLVAVDNATRETILPLHRAARTQSPRYYLGLGRRATARRPNLARYAYERAVALMPDTAPGKFAVAARLVELGDKAQIETLRRLYETAASPPPGWATRLARLER